MNFRLMARTLNSAAVAAVSWLSLAPSDPKNCYKHGLTAGDNIGSGKDPRDFEGLRAELGREVP